MTTVFKIENLSKKFVSKESTKIVLDNVNISMQSGEIFGLIGLNGIGKTTMIRTALDLIEADSGTISFFDKSHKDKNSRQDICYLPERFHPSAYLTGFEFLHISNLFYGKTLDKAKAEELALRVDLDPSALGKQIKSYSKGMGQKVGLISCFLSDTPLLILDEPMSGLDPKARIGLKDLIMDYKQSGKSIFFSSHILADVDEICDRINILNNTKIVFDGVAEDLKKQFNEQSLERAFLKLIS